MKRLTALIILTLLTGCATGLVPSAANLTAIAQLPEGPTKAAAQSTAVTRYLAAQAASDTINAYQAQANASLAQAEVARAEMDHQTTMLTVEAQAILDTQASHARATTQALDARATSQALDAQATTQAGATAATATAEARAATSTAESRNAQATTQALNARATATASMATATMQTAIDNVELTAQAAQGVILEATAQAVQRQTKIDEDRKILTTFGGWGLLLIGYATIGWVLYQLLPVIKLKIGQVYRDKRGDLPAMAAATAGGVVALYDFTRGFSPATFIDPTAQTITQPLLTATVKLQEETTKRSQFVDWVKGGRPVPILPSFTNSPALITPDNGNSQWQDLAEQQPWPTTVNLPELFAHRTASLNSLVIGCTNDSVITSSLHEMMHTLVVGTSGWGKSTWLRSLIWQFAQVEEAIQIAAIDISGSEFNLLHNWNKLAWPVAQTMRDAQAILHLLSEELNRRRQLFKDIPLATKLTEYNRIAGQNLPPFVLIADEGAALLNRETTKEDLREVIQFARQYGIYCVLTTVSATFRTIPTSTRDQFSTRICFKTSPSSSQVVLNDSRAATLRQVGRFYASLAGQELIEAQGTWITRELLHQALTTTDRPLLMPRVTQTTDKAEEIKALLENQPDLSNSAIARDVYGYANSRSIETVRQIRQQQSEPEIALK